MRSLGGGGGGVKIRGRNAASRGNKLVLQVFSCPLFACAFKTEQCNQNSRQNRATNSQLELAPPRISSDTDTDTATATDTRTGTRADTQTNGDALPAWPAERTSGRANRDSELTAAAAGPPGPESRPAAAAARPRRRAPRSPWATLGPSGQQQAAEARPAARSLLMPISELRVSGSKLEPPSRPTVDWSKQRPYFGQQVERNVSVELGKTAHLTCKVFELGDKTVSCASLAPTRPARRARFAFARPPSCGLSRRRRPQSGRSAPAGRQSISPPPPPPRPFPCAHH